MRIAEVAFNIPLERTFHYLIPEALDQAVQPGVRVAAPFGPRERVGFVLKRVPKSPFAPLKPIRRAIDSRPVITGERWALAEWVASYYYCSLGEALAAMVPSGLRLTPEAAEALQPPEPAASPLTLTPHQQRGLEIILKAMAAPASQRVLLYGVTGSGKTELYLRAIAHALGEGRSAICLIPEIALTPQTIDRFQARFPGQVAVWHSRLTARQRRETWARLADGSCRIVVGARSAVFAPVVRLGLVIIDEEHEPTYKQEDTPRYHARDVAAARARLTNASVILGSATPSIESYYEAAEGRIHLVHLPERIKGRQLPAVEIIDMRQQPIRRAGPLSDRLQRALQQAVDRDEQAMLLLNRRGFARMSQCKTCGMVERCTRCAIPLVYHASRQELQCHYCEFHRPPADLCPECKKGYMRLRGSGTERVESELHRLFPASAIARMDRDTTKGRESHRELYDALNTRQVRLLVGTQMIAKGFDFPDVTLVGVVSADTALNLPDFRAGERTFDLLTQMAGRAGRGEQPGRVLIQTFCPGHYAIQAAKTHDYGRFYKEEIDMRCELKLPPAAHLVELMLFGSSQSRVAESAALLAERLRHAIARKRIVLLGPVPHRIPRLRGNYRVCVVLKARAAEAVIPVLQRVLQPGRKFRGMPVVVDVDPL